MCAMKTANTVMEGLAVKLNAQQRCRAGVYYDIGARIR